MLSGAQVNMVVGYGSMVVVLGLAAGLAHSSFALRDPAPGGGWGAFSLARTLLWWWTTVILSLAALAYAQTGEVWPMNGTTLTLLGISVGTTAAGRIIDGRRNPFEFTGTKEGKMRDFFTDILSDEHGVSIHRFQSVVFNVWFAAVFAAETLRAMGLLPVSAGAPEVPRGFHDFDTMTLGLLGISAGAYVTLKANESAPPKGADPEPAKPAVDPSTAVG